jgi:hypothetical protein
MKIAPLYQGFDFKEEKKNEMSIVERRASRLAEPHLSASLPVCGQYRKWFPP